MKTTTKLAGWLCALFSMTGCMAVVQGNGVQRTEAREVAEFNSISIGHGFVAEATLGSPASLTLEADENLLPHVVATVSVGRLVVDAPDGTLLMARSPVKLRIVSPTLTAVEASGESKVTAEASPTDSFSIDASGGSSITLRSLSSDKLTAGGSGLSRLIISGTARQASFHLSGGSSIDGRELATETVGLDGSGGSSGTVRATAQVTGGLSGASHITVLGRPPMVNVGLSGGSTIEMAD
jgi:hypothetical protein